MFTATTTNGPGVLPGVSGVTSVSGPATAYSNVDPFSDAIYTSAQHNGVITALVTNPATAQALAKVKQYGSAGSDVPLLGADPAMPGHQQILGIPLFTSPYVTTTNNVVWGIPKQFGYFVLRQDARWRATEASSSTRLGWQCGRHNRRKPGHRPGYRTTLGASRWGQRSGTLTNVPAEVAEYWERHGWVTVVDDKPAAKPKAEPKPEPASEKK